MAKPLFIALVVIQLVLGLAGVWWLTGGSASFSTPKPRDDHSSTGALVVGTPEDEGTPAFRARTAMQGVCGQETITGNPHPHLLDPSTLTGDLANPRAFCSPDDFAEISSSPLLPRGFDYRACVYNPQIDVYISATLKGGRFWDAHIVEEMVDYLKNKPPGVIIDAGGNIGQFSLVAAAHGHKVFAFEPVEHTANIFLKSIALMKLQDRITLFRNALGSARGVTEINVNADNAGGSTIVAKSKRDRLETIEVMKFDDFLPSIEKVTPADMPWHVIKADVEGCEPRFLMGAIEALIKHRPPLMLIEYTPKNNAKRNCDGARFFWALSELGYKVSFGAHSEIPSPPRTSLAETTAWYHTYFRVIHNTYDLTCTL